LRSGLIRNLSEGRQTPVQHLTAQSSQGVSHSSANAWSCGLSVCVSLISATTPIPGRETLGSRDMTGTIHSPSKEGVLESRRTLPLRRDSDRKGTKKPPKDRMPSSFDALGAAGLQQRGFSTVLSLAFVAQVSGKELALVAFGGIWWPCSACDRRRMVHGACDRQLKGEASLQRARLQQEQ
jgi:hypothetical protein